LIVAHALNAASTKSSSGKPFGAHVNVTPTLPKEA